MKFLDLSGLSYFTGLVKGLLEGKVDKEVGKGLSTNDYTSAEKSKLSGIASNANNYTHPNSGATAGTYRSVTVNAQGHITGGTNPTTLSGYGVSDVPASMISGKINITNLPSGALERCIVVADDVARYALTADQAQVGDTVKVQSSGLMYFIVDDAKLSTSAGYEAYTAGSASSVPWSGITDKPSTFTPSSHAHSEATGSAGGFLSASDKTKLDGISTGANKYSHPTYSSATAGLYKVTVDTTGHVSATSAVSKADITALGIPSSDTTYSTASTSSNGLMSSTDKSKLDGVATGANNYTHPAYTSATSGLYKVTVDASGHVSATTAVTKADITALGVASTDTVYSNATTTTSGLMSSTDKVKLDGVEAGANKYVHPTSAGYNHVPTGGASGQFLKWSASGVATWSDVPEDTPISTTEIDALFAQ